MRAGRRWFLTRAAMAVAAGGLAGCTDGHTVDSSSSLSTADLDKLRLVASVENLMVATYGVIIAGAGSGRLGAVTPTVTTLAQTVRGHHRVHLGAVNDVLTGAGHSAVTQSDPVLSPAILAEAASVSDVTSAAALAAEIENICAETHQRIVASATGARVPKVSGSIAPVEMQHAALWSLLAGRYPGVVGPGGQAVAFSPLSFARPLTDLYPVAGAATR